MNKVKNVNYGASARQKLQAGVNKLGNAVKATMGPSGRTVILEREYGTPVITKDGVSVAKEVNLKNRKNERMSLFGQSLNKETQEHSHLSNLILSNLILKSRKSFYVTV